MKSTLIILTILLCAVKCCFTFNEQVIEHDTGVNQQLQEEPEFLRNISKRSDDRVKKYDGNQLWKVQITDEVRPILERLKTEKAVTQWLNNQTYADILIDSTFLDYVKSMLFGKNVKYDILLEDVQKAIDEENPPINYDYNDRKGHRLTWGAYHRLNDIYGFLDYLAETYPDLCKVYTIGYSHEGRPLRLLKISNGNHMNKAFWVDGGIHAREWISPATVTYFINHLVLNYEQEPESVQNIDWYILPVINPDGYEYTHTVDRFWRKNRKGWGSCPGTDLNRNFGFKWGGKGVSKNPCDETYGGSGPFSEPESFAVQKFIMATKARWTNFISFHSYGQYILYPWGYDRIVSQENIWLDSLAKKATAAIKHAGGEHYTAGNSATTLYPAAGGSDDWAMGVAGFKYAYTIELRDNGKYGFVLPAPYIVPTAREAMIALRVFAEASE